MFVCVFKTFILKRTPILGKALSFMLLLTAFNQLYAEGSREITPNMSNHSALVIMPSIGTGSYLNAPAENRIFFNINNLNERLYYGTNWYEYGTTASGGAYVGNTMYARIYGPNGVQVGSDIQMSGTASPSATTTGHIADLTRAQNGPNIGSVTNGYNPLTFTPATTGEHYIVFYKTGSNSGTGDWYKSIYFDFTVATTTGVKRAGRVFSKKWGFVAINSSLMPFAQADVSPTFYSYSLDSTISRITFETGFRPIAYDVAINHYGVANTGNWGIDRRSVNSAASPSLPDGYKLFLNRPDSNIYTVPTIAAQPYLADPPLVGCGAPYQLRFVMPAAGDARILLDLNGVPEYQHGTADRIIEVFNVQAGLNTVLWDGLNGLGASVASGTNIKITATYQRGRFNIPIYDAEINKNGFNIAAIAPVATSHTRLYWDDSGLTSIGSCPASNADQANNNTGAGINNVIVGTLSPAHAWNGNGNPTQLIPAPAVGANETNNNQCDDFGNVRTINTWGWALSVESNILSMDFFCRRISGTVYNDVNGLTDNTVNGTPIGSPSGEKLYAVLIYNNQVFDTVSVKSNGTFEFAYATFTNGNYSVYITNTPPVPGSAPGTSQLPYNWVNTGEYRGALSATGSDGNINGRYSFTVNDADITQIKYGIQQRPEANDKTENLQGNPGGTIQVPVDPSLFVPADYDGGSFSKIRITGFPSNTTSIVISGISYTASNFPAGGIEIPTNAFGHPTQTITVDPIDGSVTVSIPYKAFDNAGFESFSTGNINLPFSILSIRKRSDVENTYREGDTITYTIVIKNDDNFDHSNVILRDTLPSGVSFLAGSLNVSVGNPVAPVSDNVTYNSGTGIYNTPAGADSLKIQSWGGGGRGGSRTTGSSAYGGGGGGAYSESTIFASNSSYYYSVGGGSSNNGTDGGDSWFSTTNNSSGAVVLAKGGITVSNNTSTGGAGGLSSQGIGLIKFNGGSGANGSGSNGGGGGSSAGTLTIGNNGSGSTGGTAPANGGNGGNGRSGSSGAGNSGIAPGGGGGGAYRTGGGGSPSGGDGANGRIIISYSIPGTNGSISNPPLLASGWKIQAGDSLVATYKVIVNTPSAVDSIRNTAYATTASISKPIIASVTDYPTNTTNAVNDENSTWINTPVSGDVTTNDFDLEGHTQTFGSFLNQNGSGNPISSGSTVSGTNAQGNTVANAGTLTFNPNGTYTYTPANNFVGNISVPYSICDNGHPVACDTAYLDITVSPLPNITNSVIANNDEYFSYGNPVNANVFVNDKDPQGDNFSVTGIRQGNTAIPVGTPTVVSGIDENGHPVANAGTLTQNANGTMTFTPASGFVGQVTYNYTITDNGTPVASDNATVVITVVRDQNGPQNDPPFAGDDFSYTTVNTPVNGNFTGNDSDPNNDPISIKNGSGNPVTIVPGGPKTSVITKTTEEGGTVEFFSDGTYTYTPPTGYVGPDRVVYEICDVTVIQPQPLCAQATIHLLVGTKNTTNAVNDENSTWINTPVSGDVTTNDFDREGHTQHFGSFLNQNGSGNPISSGSTVSGTNAQGNTVANAGTLTFNTDGTYTYSPADGFTGNISVPYSICDNGHPVACDTAYLDITVSPLPNITNSVIANNDEYFSYGNPINANVFVNDKDPQGDNFSVTGIRQGNTAIPVGTPTVVSGIDENGHPVANAGTLTQNANGTMTFVPAPGFAGQVTYNYTITDNGTPVASDNATVVITVLRDQNGPLNDPPFAGDDFSYTSINTPVNGNFSGNDKDPNNDPISIKDNNGNPVTIVPGGPKTSVITVLTEEGGSVEFFSDGTYTYTPPTGYIGPDRVIYEICDVTVIQPQPLCAQATIHLLVGTKNTTNAVNDENSTWINTPVSGDVTTNDFDLEGHTQHFGSFLNQNGSGNTISSGNTVAGTDANGNPVANAGTLIFDANGNYIYIPANNFTGNISVPYSICDNGHPVACDTAVLDITVSPLPNIANSVIANNDEYFSYGNPVNANVFINDKDPQGDNFSVTSYRYDSNGDGVPDAAGSIGTPVVVGGVREDGSHVANAGTLTQNANGTMTFVPAPGFAGQVTYNYTITDNGTPVTSDNATVVITVLKDQNGPLNDPPFAGDDFSYTSINTPVNGNFSGNDKDPNNDPISIADENGNPVTIVPGGPKTSVITVLTEEGGSVEFFSDGTYTYTPPTGYIGPDRVIYEICDVTVIQPQPLCAQATIHLLVGTGYTITGNVYNDGNGMTDNFVNASNGSTNAGNKLYAVLTDTNGKVLQSVPVDADGTYEFINVPGAVSLQVLLDTISRAKDEVTTASALPSGWVNTGERIGISQGHDGSINGVSAVIPALTADVNNVNFGIQRIPVADAKLYAVANVAFEKKDANDPLYPNEPGFETFFLITTASSHLTGNGLGGSLTGTDPEDCPNALDCNTGKRFLFGAALPSTVVYYNFGGETGTRRLMEGDFIPDYNPAYLIIAAREGSGMSDDPVGFTYSLVDNAGFPSIPVTYTILTESALPVELLYFTATVTDCKSVLTWATASELNNDYFEVQKSSDAEQWTTLGKVDGNGTSNFRNDYSFEDGTSGNGMTYYRLKQVDFDGTAEYHRIIQVERAKCYNYHQIVVYPNPAQNILNIRFESALSDKSDILIIDATGKIVKNLYNITHTHQLDVSNMPSGTYYLRIVSNNEQTDNIPFVILK